MQPNLKDGYIKCRLIHLDGGSVVQPDILFRDHQEGDFFIPRFFYRNCISYFDDASENQCHFILVVQDDICLCVNFLKRNHLVTFSDGSVIYKCTFSKLSGEGEPQIDGRWCLREEQRFQLNLFHHTTEAGYHDITKSQEIWGSRLNIQGNLYLSNIAYGYFTNLPAIRTEEDLQKIAMSNSGLIGVVPTNAPYHPHYAKSVPIPKKQPTHVSRVMGFWIDADLIAPNHLWLHRPMGHPLNYEVVLPNVFRVGVQPDANLLIDRQEIRIPEQDRKNFNSVIVGNADTYEGLQAPFNEEETKDLAAIDQFAADDEITEFWQQNANSNLFDGRTIEHPEFNSPEDQ